jgi:hypothetical protein
MKSIFSDFDLDEERTVSSTESLLHAQCSMEGRLTLKIGQRQRISGKGRLVGSILVFHVEQEIIRIHSLSWKLVEPFEDLIGPNQSEVGFVVNSGDVSVEFIATGPNQLDKWLAAFGKATI